MSCQESKCQCDSTQKYWSNKVKKCVNLLSYGETGCNLDQECTGNLKCDFEICACERSSLKEIYWHVTEKVCLEKKKLTEFCEDSNEYSNIQALFCLNNKCQ